nr:unnamed protein product [Spirometra erinaceieuropaei]
MVSISDAPTVETVLQAIYALYINPDNTVKENASKWLCAFQQSVYAWEISDQLLYLKRDLSSSYFGAQTIRIKIQMYFTELPTGSHMALKDSLLNHVLKLTEDTHVSIANQLCLAVSDLFCQMVQWNDAIGEIVRTLSSSETSSAYLVDILRFIAEEISSKTLRLGLNRRQVLMSHAESQKQLVLDFLSFRIKNANASMMARIFNCLASWWDNTGVMAETDVRISPLLEAAFYVLRNPTSYPEPTYDAAMEWILALLCSCSTQQGYTSQLLKFLQTNIYGLLDVFQQCIVEASKSEDASAVVDRAANIAQIFAALTRAVRMPLVDSPSAAGSGEAGDLRTLDCLLAVLEAPPPVGCRTMTLHTFYALQSLAEDAARHQMRLAPSPGRSGLKPPTSPAGDMSSPQSRPVTALIPYFTRVVVALTRYCPSNTEDLEAAEDLRQFREDAHSLMQDIVDLVGADTIFVELHAHIQKLQELAASNPTLNMASVLQESEACLFMLTTVAKRLSPHDPEGRIGSLISSLVLPGLDSDPPAPLQEVGCLLYTELAHWAACHPELRRRIVDQLVRIVERAVDVPATQLRPGQKQAVGAALVALGSLCAIYRVYPSTSSSTDRPMNGTTGAAAAASLLDEHWKDLIFLVVYSLPRLGWVPVNEAIDFFEGVVRGLMASIVFAPGSPEPLAPRKAFPERIAQLTSVSVECLTKLVEQNVPIDGADTMSDPCVWLDYLATIFRSLANLLPRLDDTYRRSHLSSGTYTDAAAASASPVSINQAELANLAESSQACLDGSLRVVTQLIWPTIGRVLQHYSTKVRPMERCCRVIRFMARSFSVNLRELLPDIANKLVESYSQGHHSCFLYLSGVLVDVFGDLPDCRVGLVGLFEALAPPTLASLMGNALAEQPHTVEDFFRLCSRLVQHCAPLFLTSTSFDLAALLDTSIRSLDLPTIATSSAAADDLNVSSSSQQQQLASKAGTSATAASARFLFELLLFTAESSEDQPVAVMTNATLPSISHASGVAARRLLIWLLRPSSADQECGGQRLTTACVHSCCLGLPDERFPDIADILHQLKNIMPREIFATWLNNAVASLPVSRADGLVQATDEQISDFKQAIMNASRTAGIIHALDCFVLLFR